jgi:DNA polymerase III delta subunit
VEFAAFLADKSPAPPILIFQGSETFLRERGLAAARARWPDLASNALRLPSSDVTWQALADELFTAGLLGGRKLVVLADEGNWLHNNLAAFKEYLKAPASSAVLLALVPSDKSLGVKESDSLRLVDCRPPKPVDLPRIVQTLVQERGKTIDRAALETLCSRGGPDLVALAGHVETICTYVGRRPAIAAADVAAHVHGEAAHKDYELALACAKKQPRRALELARALVDAGDPAQKILWKLAWQYRKMVEGRKLLESGVRRGEVTSRLQITYFQTEFLGLVDGHSLGELLEKHGEILKADLALKTGGGTDHAVLESLVAKLASSMAAQKG